MSHFQKIYLGLGALIVVFLGVLIYSHMGLSREQDLLNREMDDLFKIEKTGEAIFQHLEMVRAQNHLIDENRKGNLNMSTILNLTKEKGLKSPATSKESLTKRPTYNEKIIDLKLKDEYLEAVVQFMIAAEALGNSKVTKIDVLRSPKDKELWNCTITIRQRVKKDSKEK